MKSERNVVKVVNKGGIGSTLFLMWAGALVYFIQNSHGFGGFIIAVLKACVWPAYVVHAVLGLLHL